jgi:hypothetical protein
MQNNSQSFSLSYQLRDKAQLHIRFFLNDDMLGLERARKASIL